MSLTVGLGTSTLGTFGKSLAMDRGNLKYAFTASTAQRVLLDPALPQPDPELPITGNLHIHVESAGDLNNLL